METPKEFLSRHNIKYRFSGENLELGCLIKTCPNYQEKQMYIHATTGVWYCHRCGSKGSNLKQLEFKAGLIALQDSVNSNHIFISPLQYETYHKELLQNKDVMDYLLRVRGLTKPTLVQFQIGFSKDDNAIVFPYFDKSDACVGLKYYYWKKPVKPKMMFKKNSKMQAYGLNIADLNKPLVITEGEFDALTAWQCGQRNVVSAPNGAQSVNGWVDDIEVAPLFKICYDNDSAGYEGTQRLGDRLGLSKCFKIPLRMKDLNEYLQHGIAKSEIDKAFKGAIPMFQAPLQALTDYADKAIDMIQNPQQHKGIDTGWKSVNWYLGGIRMGEVTVASGITSHGKTTFSMCLLANLAKNGTKCLVLSPEMPEYDLLLELANNYHKTKVTRAEQVHSAVEIYKDCVETANVFNEWTNRSKQPLLNRTFDIIDHAVKVKGVKFVLIDHLRLFLSMASQDQERLAIDNFIQKCVRTAIAHKIHIWLVVQPKNLPANQRKITMHDLKGSSNIGQDAHNIVLIHRDLNPKQDSNLVQFEVPKVRSTSGNLGSFTLSFDVKSKANYYETN